MISTGANGTVESLRKDLTGMKMLPVTILADYRENGASGFIDFGTFSAEDTAKLTEEGIAKANAIGDGWTHPELMGKPDGRACTACIKKLDDGTVVMGRNMDLPVSFSPVYTFRTKGNGTDTYDTVNIGYSTSCPVTFDQVAETSSFPEAFFSTMLLITTDTLNSEGLYMQFNMRDCKDVPTTGTNPDSKLRTCILTLNRLIGDHCATIEDALEYVKKLDIYDPKSLAFDWSMGIGMMDRTGRYGVLEVTNNKIIWNEGRPGFACGQCNFFWNKEGAEKSNWDVGFGRWHELMERYNDINSLDDMYEAMKHIWYSNLITNGVPATDWNAAWEAELTDYTNDTIKNKWVKAIKDWKKQYNIAVDEKELARVEEIAERQIRDNIVWSESYLNSPSGCYDAITVLNLVAKCFVQLPNEVQKASGYMEASTISYVSDNKNPEFRLHIFEMDDVFHLGVSETKIDRISTAKVLGR